MPRGYGYKENLVRNHGYGYKRKFTETAAFGWLLGIGLLAAVIFFTYMWLTITDFDPQCLAPGTKCIKIK